mmetsp:Transcript_101468/g.310277  ORF Transcript_101468/g.310277 Transcript_101468/m.310277 type:complete len:499 (-) Transcript_101468:384-1880(-)
MLLWPRLLPRAFISLLSAAIISACWPRQVSSARRSSSCCRFTSSTWPLNEDMSCAKESWSVCDLLRRPCTSCCMSRTCVSTSSTLPCILALSAAMVCIAASLPRLASASLSAAHCNASMRSDWIVPVSWLTCCCNCACSFRCASSISSILVLPSFAARSTKRRARFTSFSSACCLSVLAPTPARSARRADMAASWSFCCCAPMASSCCTRSWMAPTLHFTWAIVSDRDCSAFSRRSASLSARARMSLTQPSNASEFFSHFATSADMRPDRSSTLYACALSARSCAARVAMSRASWSWTASESRARWSWKRTCASRTASSWPPLPSMAACMSVRAVVICPSVVWLSSDRACTAASSPRTAPRAAWFCCCFSTSASCCNCAERCMLWICAAWLDTSWSRTRAVSALRTASDSSAACRPARRSPVACSCIARRPASMPSSTRSWLARSSRSDALACKSETTAASWPIWDCISCCSDLWTFVADLNMLFAFSMADSTSRSRV